MSDNRDHMIELLSVSKAEGIYSSTIRHTIAGQELELKFGIETSDYSRLKRILEFRPFEDTGFAPYRYFFALSYSSSGKENPLARTAIRVEQGRMHKQFDFEISKKYLSNLEWFRLLESTDPVREMIVNPH